MRLAAFALVVIGCGGGRAAAPVEPPPPDAWPRVLPMLEDRVVLDVPLWEASSAVQDAWHLAQRALADPVPEGPVPDAIPDYRAWGRRQKAAIAELVRDLDGEDPLFTAILVGVVTDSYLQRILSAPAPSLPYGTDEARAAFYESLEKELHDWIVRAHDAFEACAHFASRASDARRAWAATCVERADHWSERLRM